MTWPRICILYAFLCILSLNQAEADQRDSLLTLGQKYLREAGRSRRCDIL